MKQKPQRDKINRRLLSLLNQTQLRDHTGSWEWKQDAGVYVWSDALFTLHDLPKPYDNEIATTAAHAFMTPKDRALFEAHLAGLLPGGRVQFPCRIRFPGGEKRKVLITAYRLADQEGNDTIFGEYKFLPVVVKQANSTQHIAAVPVNNAYGYTKIIGGTADNVPPEIAAQLRAAEHLTTLNATLQEKNRQLESMNDELMSFSYIASHDLREPLRKLQLFGNMLLQQHRADLPDIVKEYLGKIDLAAQRMNTLIDDVLIFSRINERTDMPTPVDLIDILAQVREDLYEPVTRYCALLHPFDLPVVMAHASTLYLLFFHFISNSLKFRKPDLSPVIIIRGQVKAPWEWPGTQPAPEQPWLQLSFTDNGIGFEEKYQETAFKMFQRLHDKDLYPGTGIGLAICKKVAATYQGYIDVKSEVGKGTTFTCYLQLDIVA
ncbi:His Kinase A (phospho-acceptor) domain-containing protein [Chitinophaga costaii]|uniref:histidine kinase n=1 Tax=Chitinophaga costaii TaxID=1335309 RepID=A0A1C4CNC9_9BACT|nr:ATP-binding protein [Chitinophaga costaii]PUZ27021.1 hypothetical protein DCM91_07235 [Chitinophaga costaii]SCC20570.1 His Kinase A (phospho-acceptor) domain-containing protein [Chitinophaga costaii]